MNNKKILLSLVAILLTSCTNEHESTSINQKESGKIETDLIEVLLNNFTDEVDIHTELQLKSINGGFDYVPDEAVGTAELSKPKPIKLAWDFLDDDNFEYINDFSGFTVTLATDEQLTDVVYSINTNDTFAEVTNLYLGKNYYWNVKANFGNVYIESETGSFKTKSKGPRNLDVDSVTNVRDLGGYKTKDNKTIKQGLIYRTARYSKNYTKQNEISEKGIDTMVNFLGIKTDIDLRTNSDGESGNLTKSPLGSSVKYVSAPMKYEKYDDILTDFGKNGMKKVFQELANVNSYPLAFHCSIGTDRTGRVACLLLGLLGVSEEDIFRDYMFSNYGNIGGYRTTATLKNLTIAALNNEYKAATLQEEIIKYLLDIGISQLELDAIRNILLED